MQSEKQKKNNKRNVFTQINEFYTNIYSYIIVQ